MILAASVLFLAAQSGLYEEDPLATMRVRVDNWKQIEAYAIRRYDGWLVISVVTRYF